MRRFHGAGLGRNDGRNGYKAHRNIIGFLFRILEFYLECTLCPKSHCEVLNDYIIDLKHG
jgi:hypothetical protein